LRFWGAVGVVSLAAEAPVVEAARVAVTVAAAATFTVVEAVPAAGRFVVVKERQLPDSPIIASKSYLYRYGQREGLVPKPWHGTPLGDNKTFVLF
jgi:hypothetical protein